MSNKMYNYKRLPLISFGRNVLAAAVASSLFFMSNASATGLGRLTVLSALGQPLRAEIELTSPNKDEITSLSPKLASVDAFKQASIDFNPALLSMRFTVEARGAGYIIRVTSTQAMNEPFVDLLLEMNSSNGKLLREYTFLLDPAELRNSQSAQVANPVNIVPASPVLQQSKPASQEVAQARATGDLPAPQKSIQAKNPSISKNLTAGEGYRVKSGDTLSKVAGEYRTEGVSLDQMLVSLYRANPNAFSGSNMNRLKVGQILTIPDTENNKGSTVVESHSVVMAHAADFNAYRNKLAGQVAEAPAKKTENSKQAVSGTITAKVKEVPTATNESLDKLKLSKASASASSKSGIAKAYSEEDKLAKEKAIAEANSRVKELEKNVAELTQLAKLRDIKDKEMAERQMAATAKAEAKNANVKATTAVASLPAASVVASVSASAAASVVTAPPLPTPEKSSAVASVPKKKIAPPPPPEPSFFESVMDSGFVIPLGIIAALVAAFGIFTTLRKKKSQQFDDSILTGSSMKANSMFGSTGGQSVDTNNSVFNSNFAPSSSQLDANEVDPIAEADVYIAYGRDSQAEEILKEALRTQPDRHAVRVKLLEIYHNRKDPRSFERLASELYGMTSGEGDEWAQAASMGVVLEPTNPLYAGGKAQSDVQGAGLGVSTQPLEELDPEALLGNSLSDDMLDSISIIDTASGLTDDEASKGVKSNEADSFDIGNLDFDLDMPNTDTANQFNAPLLPENSSTASSASQHQMAEEIHDVDFGTIDFDLDTGNVSAQANAEIEGSETASVTMESDVGTTNLSMLGDANDITFESALSSEKIESVDSAEAPASFEFDLSGIDLDLEPGSAQSDLPVATDNDEQAYNAEMATKLDLAVAYHEIGDKEGARELLDEVVKGGTVDQIEKAKVMLEQLI
jgi:pilus assembly protein FimV